MSHFCRKKRNKKLSRKIFKIHITPLLIGIKLKRDNKYWYTKTEQHHTCHKKIITKLFKNDYAGLSYGCHFTAQKVIKNIISTSIKKKALWHGEYGKSKTITFSQMVFCTLLLSNFSQFIRFTLILLGLSRNPVSVCW